MRARTHLDALDTTEPLLSKGISSDIANVEVGSISRTNVLFFFLFLSPKSSGNLPKTLLTHWVTVFFSQSKSKKRFLSQSNESVVVAWFMACERVFARGQTLTALCRQNALRLFLRLLRFFVYLFIIFSCVLFCVCCWCCCCYCCCCCCFFFLLTITFICVVL